MVVAALQDCDSRIFITKGPVIALELNGDGVVEACKNTASEVFSGTKVSSLTHITSLSLVKIPPPSLEHLTLVSLAGLRL